MKKISKKLLLSLLGAAVAIVMAVTLIGSCFAGFTDRETQIGMMYVSQVIILVLVIVAFYYIVDWLIIRRIRALNEGMKKVAGGEFETHVAVKGNDELSGLTESFNQMADELRLNAFLSRDFARYVSHEFKTPLCVIRNYAEITQYETDPLETQKNMAIIMSETDRLTELSKNILELCRLDSTAIIEKKDCFSPAAQLRTVLLDYQTLWSEKDIEIVPELDEFEITGNEALLFRVWQNIIGNAIKFTENNGHIEVSLKTDGHMFTCRIKDDGCGIPSEDKEYIFTPFYSGNRQHNKEGSGMGLALSKKIIDKLGGTILFESEAGKGTTFTITLPY